MASAIRVDAQFLEVVKLSFEPLESPMPSHCCLGSADVDLKMTRLVQSTSRSSGDRLLVVEIGSRSRRGRDNKQVLSDSGKGRHRP